MTGRPPQWLEPAPCLREDPASDFALGVEEPQLYFRVSRLRHQRRQASLQFLSVAQFLGGRGEFALACNSSKLPDSCRHPSLATCRNGNANSDTKICRL